MRIEDPTTFTPGRHLAPTTFTVELTAEDVIGLSAAISDSKRMDQINGYIAAEFSEALDARDAAWVKITKAYDKARA